MRSNNAIFVIHINRTVGRIYRTKRRDIIICGVVSILNKKKKKTFNFLLSQFTHFWIIIDWKHLLIENCRYVFTSCVDLMQRHWIALMNRIIVYEDKIIDWLNIYMSTIYLVRRIRTWLMLILEKYNFKIFFFSKTN